MSRNEPHLDTPRDEIVTHLPALRGYALGLTRNPSAADDLVRDTIVKAWTHFDSFQTGTNLRSWLFTILRNTFYSELRRQKYEVADSDGVFAARLCTAPAHDQALAYREFLTAFARLGAEQREALTLVGALGFSCEEAAQTMGVAVGTVKSRVSRARRTLAVMLGLAGGETVVPMPDAAQTAVLTQGAAQLV